MKHTPGPVEASLLAGPYPVCICDHENFTLSWFVNADGPVRERAQDDAEFIAWCYNNAPLVEAAPAMYEALEGLRIKGGCFCDASFTMNDGSHPSHSPECEAALHALAAARGES